MAATELDTTFLDLMSQMQEVISEADTLDKTKYINDLTRMVSSLQRDLHLPPIYTD